ncbi:MAG: Fur family transcriptional regulator [Desulfobacteraceae bacterium]
MSDPKARFEVMVAKLREQNFRITPQRLAILKILSQSIGHPSVEEIYAKVKPDFPTTSLATIYKNVSILKEMGQVLELAFSGTSSRYDGLKPYPHPHLICTQCGAIQDPDLVSLKEMKAELMQATGYYIAHHRLDFFGLCPECREKEKRLMAFDHENIEKKKQ